MFSTNNKIIRGLRALPFSKYSVTLVSGYFDLLHPGHIAFLKKCRSLGFPLLVAIYSDKVCSLKTPGRPILNENDRVQMLNELTFVDWIYISHSYPSEDKGGVYRHFKPKIVVFSTGENNLNVKDDEIELLKHNFPEIEINYIPRQRLDISTTKIIEKVVNMRTLAVSSPFTLNTIEEIKNKLNEILVNSNATNKQAAVLLDGRTGSFLSSGYNYHPKLFGKVVHKNKETNEHTEGLPRPIHSEVVAVINFLKFYRCLPDEKVFLYTTTLPCAGCAEIISLIGIKNIRYINDFDNNYGKLILLNNGIDIKKF